MYLQNILAVLLLCLASTEALPVGGEVRRSGTDRHIDSALGTAGSHGKRRDANTDWYADSAQGVSKSVQERDSKDTDWYTDSAQGVSKSVQERDNKDTDWYADSAQGVSKSVQERDNKDTDWYADSAQGVSKFVQERDNKDTDWYTDSASGVSKAILTSESTGTDWYTDSAQGVVDTIDKRGETDDTDWYADSASGISKAVAHTKRGDDSDWYTDSAQGVASSIEERGMSVAEKDSYELDLRRWIYDNMREESLRETSERGKALFEYDVKPRYDQVDRWHIPADLRGRYDHSESDAEKVSVLNYYLMVTGREPKSALELGFTPTASEPGLVETNEVGYGYALASQHQIHCVDFVADAIDIGKANINDFYLKHTIHCLGLLKYLAPNLTMKQPLAFLRRPANDLLLAGYRQTSS